MAERGFVLASSDSGGFLDPLVEKALAAAFAEAQGALVVVNGSGQFAACGADPALVAGVTNTPGGTDTSGFNILGSKEFPPGYMQVIPARGNLFRAPYVGTLPAADGGEYGVIRDSDGIWKVDFDELAAPVVVLAGRLTDDPEDQPEVLVRFLDSVIQDI
jgi:hypothetical protein